MKPWHPTEPIRLQRVRLNSGGYDRFGTYFGAGEPLWYAEQGDKVEHVRAPTREKAKEILSFQPGWRYGSPWRVTGTALRFFR